MEATKRAKHAFHERIAKQKTERDAAAGIVVDGPARSVAWDTFVNASPEDGAPGDLLLEPTPEADDKGGLRPSADWNAGGDA